MNEGQQRAVAKQLEELRSIDTEKAVVDVLRDTDLKNENLGILPAIEFPGIVRRVASNLEEALKTDARYYLPYSIRTDDSGQWAVDDALADLARLAASEPVQRTRS